MSETKALKQVLNQTQETLMGKHFCLFSTFEYKCHNKMNIKKQKLAQKHVLFKINSGSNGEPVQLNW